MANYAFTITWTRPDGSSADITDRVMLEGLGDITAAFEAADELFTYTSSDVDVSLDNQDGFFTAEMAPFPGKTSALADIRSRFIVAIERDGVQLFRGFVLPNKMQFDRFERTAKTTILSPLRLCDLAKAELVRRQFAGMTVGASYPEGSLVVGLSAVPAEQVFPGDVVLINGTEYELTGVNGGQLNLLEGLQDPVGAGATVEVVTPYYRYKTIQFLVEALFLEAGISDFEISFSGVVSEDPFESPINTGPATAFTTGLSGFGDGRLFLARTATDTDPSVPRIGMAMKTINIATLETGMRQALTPDSGFEQGASLGVNHSTLPPATTVYQYGMWGAWWDERNGRGGGPTTAAYWTGASTDRRERVTSHPVDQLSCYQLPPKGFRHFTIRRAYGVAPVSSALIYLYELTFSQTVADTLEGSEGPNGTAAETPAWGVGGYDNDKLELRRYVTINQGRAWALDASFNGGTGVYSIFAGPNTGAKVFVTGAQFPLSLDGFGTVPLSSGYSHFLVLNFWSPSTNPNGVCKIYKINGATVNPSLETWGTPTRQAKAIFAGNSNRVEIFTEDATSNAILHWFWDGANAVQFVASLPITERHLMLRTLCWNALSTADSRLAAVWTSPVAGSGWTILYPGVSTLPYPAYLSGVESSDVVAADRCHFLNDFSEATAPETPIPCVGELNRMTQGARPGVVGAPELPWITRWTIVLGSDQVLTWVMRIAGRWLILSDRHLGYINYANFEGLSVSQALTQLGFVVNASINVAWQSTAFPLGQFVGRNRDPVAPVKTLQEANGAKPAGAPQALAERVRDLRAWEHNYAYIELRGSSEDIVATYGDSSRQSEALRVESRFVEFPRLAQVIAYNLWLYYAPGRRFIAAPGLSVSGTPAGVTYQYGYAPVDNFGNPLAVSKLATFVNGPASLSTGLGRIATVTIVLDPAAAGYAIYRVVAGAANPAGLVGVLNSGTIFQDDGLAADGTRQLPGEFMAPRQAVEVEVFDDGTVYSPRDEVRLADLYGQVDPASPSEAPRWWIQSVGYKATEPHYNLLIVQKTVSE